MEETHGKLIGGGSKKSGETVLRETNHDVAILLTDNIHRNRLSTEKNALFCAACFYLTISLGVVPGAILASIPQTVHYSAEIVNTRVDGGADVMAVHPIGQRSYYQTALKHLLMFPNIITMKSWQGKKKWYVRMRGCLGYGL